jgi:hypothetical protein
MSFALVRIFNAIPSPPFSAAAELRALTPYLYNLSSVLVRVWVSVPMAKSCSIHPRRPTLSDSLEERFVKARSSMALRTYLMVFSLELTHTKWKRIKKINRFFLEEKLDWIKSRECLRAKEIFL